MTKVYSFIHSAYSECLLCVKAVQISQQGERSPPPRQSEKTWTGLPGMEGDLVLGAEFVPTDKTKSYSDKSTGILMPWSISTHASYHFCLGLIIQRLWIWIWKNGCNYGLVNAMCIWTSCIISSSLPLPSTLLCVN